MVEVVHRVLVLPTAEFVSAVADVADRPAARAAPFEAAHVERPAHAAGSASRCGHAARGPNQ